MEYRGQKEEVIRNKGTADLIKPWNLRSGGKMVLECCYANVLLGSCLMFISFKLRRATLHGFFCLQRGAGISTQQQIETPVPFTFLFYAFSPFPAMSVLTRLLDKAKHSSSSTGPSRKSKFWRSSQHNLSLASLPTSETLGGGFIDRDDPPGEWTFIQTREIKSLYQL